jgi:hypothetical protein
VRIAAGISSKGPRRISGFVLNGVPGSWLPENVGDCSLNWRKESGENIIEERQELSETRRKIKERDNLVTSILLQPYLMEIDAMPKHLK